MERKRVKWRPIPKKAKFWLTCAYCRFDGEVDNVGDLLDHGKGKCDKEKQ